MVNYQPLITWTMPDVTVHLVNKKRLTNAGLMLAHRLRRGANIQPAFGELLVLDEGQPPETRLVILSI